MQEIFTIQHTKVPGLGLGTWQLNGNDCRRAVIDALTTGYRHIDTAEMYGNEEYVGQGLKEAQIPRDEIFLTTKIWYTNLSRELVSKSVEQSLRKLQTAYVDLLLIHWPNPEVPVGETIEAMQRLHQQGKVKHIGVSNFTPSLLSEALKYGNIFCNQVEYHPFLSQQPLLSLCKSHNILLTAYCPIAKGEVNNHPVLQQIAKVHQKSPVQITLRWFVQQQVSAIPKSASQKHRENNFDIFDFELNLQQMQAIDSIAQGKRLVNPSWAPNWEV